MRFLIVDDIKVDIVNYPYKWIDETVEEDGVILAGIKDIAAMKKYPDAQLFIVLKSLTYFEDAEEDPMPMMTEPIMWQGIKATIIRTVSQYLEQTGI